MSEEISNEGIEIIYDGECPFCANYVAMVHLRKAVGSVKLIDARKDLAPYEPEIKKRSLNLDDGMIIRYAGNWYHGAECINLLASLSSNSTIFNRINSLIFRSKKASKYLYPALRFCRNLTLRLLGRQKLNS